MASALISRLLAAVLLVAAPQAAVPQPATERALFNARGVAGELADKVEAMFVFPDVGARYAAALRAKAGAGAYDGITGRAELAERLSADMQAVAPEGHLRVMAGPRADGQKPPAPRPPAVEHARWLAPGIAFVRINSMLGHKDVLQQLARFMADHADAKTLILDLRNNAGGGTDEMDVILPWLYREPRLLMRLDTRHGTGSNPMAGSPSMRAESAPPGIDRFDHWVTPRKPAAPIADARVYVLTSGYTVSAAEHLATALQSTGRATVIGALTQGAGHYGPIVRLPDGFTAFLPVGRSYDPTNGEGWEGVGVSPDTEVPAEQALARALVLSGLQPAEADRLSAEVAPTGSMQHRATAPVPTARKRKS